MVRRLREACSRLSSVDLGFAVLRALVAAGGLVWLLLAPLSARLLSFFSWLFLGFCVYSLVLYGALLRWPARARRTYLATFVLDAFFLFWVVRVTGGVHSDFLLGFYLLVALHSFYYGWRFGLAAAVVAAGL
jgi:hypothetical protein